MRNVLIGAGLFLATLPALGQTIYAGDQTIDKQTYKGLFLTIPMADRQVERDWEEQLKQYGRLTTSRSVYRVTTADIRDISSEPVNLTSQLKGNKKSTTLFVAFDQGGGNFIAPGNGNYSAAETLLKNFADKTIFNDEVRGAEESFNEAQRAHQKLVKRGENLVSDIESNRKEKERLLRKIDENAKELEQLQKDVETNKTDQANALTEMDNKRKNVEAVKAKKQ
ncbi:hypothetical protein FAES_2806 [Fibrella aestuarina BUZ 2]|uniref:Uncharacterized protein n=1 Tax=Fibrella aestuarina BUZ 2 TaxID=1166018 RepID=I0K9L2_9BACT|nr:hypothetical protein [Fibrella aestuarina]CCH00815.1 hypothetical protein FAES_2806 [Fibrella aestuarina BUZ 2]